MRFVALVLLSATLVAQTADRYLIVSGRITSVTDHRIDVNDSRGTQAVFLDPTSIVWRGTERHDFSALRVGDEVIIRYRLDTSLRAVVVKLWANIDKVEGRITAVRSDGFQVDQNNDAPPESGYRRGLREVIYDSGTQWEDSLPEDLRAGRDVFVIGLRLRDNVLEATRVIVYEGRMPVRMKPGPTRTPNGSVVR